MSETDEAVGRLRAIAAGEDDAGYGFDPLSQVIVNVTDLRTLLAALARVTEELSAARRDAGAFRVAVSLALGPCAPEHEGTPVVEAIRRLREERDAANAHIALLEGEGHTGCDERIYQAEQAVEAVREQVNAEHGGGEYPQGCAALDALLARMDTASAGGANG